MVGPDWYCMCVTYALVVGGGFLVSKFVCERLEWSAIAVPIELALVGLTCCCFSFAACSDPGIVYKELFESVATLEEPGWDSSLSDGGFDEENAKKRMPKRSKCIHCEVYRLPSASHCYDCDLCISDLDHHCPWTGKCIGRKTLK
jgi:palmitoyltransferase ZDHHC9/14/18